MDVESGTAVETVKEINLEDMHDKARQYFSLMADDVNGPIYSSFGGGHGHGHGKAPAKNPTIPDVVTRFQAVTQRFPALRKLIAKSTAMQELLATPGALRKFLLAATNGGRGVDAMILAGGHMGGSDWRDIVEKAGGENSWEELQAMVEARDEMEIFAKGPGWTPGSAPLPPEPDEFESQQYLAEATQETKAEKSVLTTYFTAYGQHGDVLAPFVIFGIGAFMAMYLPVWCWLPVWFAVIGVTLRAAKASASLPGARQGAKNLFGAAMVHALMLYCGLQFAFVYVPDRVGDARGVVRRGFGVVRHHPRALDPDLLPRSRVRTSRHRRAGPVGR